MSHIQGEDPIQRAVYLRRSYKAWKRKAKEVQEPFVALPTAFSALLHAQKVTPPALRVLIFLMLNSNKAGECKESMAEIARSLGISQATVSRAFGALKDAELVEILQLQEGGSKRAFLMPFPLHKVPVEHVKGGNDK